MFEEVLSQNAKKSLALLGQNSFFKRTYLAGGTALALQLGHRESKDFDFFTKEKFNAKTLAEILTNQVGNFKEEKTSWGTILANIGKIKFSLNPLFTLRMPN